MIAAIGKTIVLENIETGVQFQAKILNIAYSYSLTETHPVQLMLDIANPEEGLDTTAIWFNTNGVNFHNTIKIVGAV